jgi:hypothetical protein
MEKLFMQKAQRLHIMTEQARLPHASAASSWTAQIREWRHLQRWELQQLPWS